MSRTEAEISRENAALPHVPKAQDEQLPLFAADAVGKVEKREAQWREKVLGPLVQKKP